MATPKADILLPLYIYPLPGAWDALHEAIAAYPSLRFTIIVNPNSGPGGASFSLPDEHYAREIPKLNARPNVCTVGYVRVDYCKRSLGEVFQEVATYAGWSRSTDRETGVTLGLHGIFFDETPNLYSRNVASYLDSVSARVKASEGILGHRLVVHNPGTVPDTGLANPGPDITAVFEESFAAYQSDGLQQRLSNLLRYDRTKCSFMVHSVPREHVRGLTQSLRWRGKYLFVTDLSENYYCRFGPSWASFCEAMARE
ncbi:cell surface spherulin 4-like protein [Glarea lozoyensis ATCC 20868]|uniref:Cell surface spherulin 4-like protein n=1 Tax=Glarea lozoyensis (strain ATCC 20868 / MF5171) TaxID=1116229 RepID=S3DZP4_GLAL2|nr:cell surface spherulin 4-like protein [Glarea lozoyensis ATCC 20868]EPE31768.1 cell surface spherulin 4-like protein [Glarea lozoyensis ATCC 20868]